MKKTISTLLALAISLPTVFGVCSWAEENTKLAETAISGINYTLYSNKKLVIDYNGTATLWLDIDLLSFENGENTYSYAKDDITSVEFTSNVRIIPQKAL